MDYIEVFDPHLELYKGVAQAGFATCEFADGDDIEPDSYKFQWATSDNVWRLNGMDELVITYNTIRHTGEHDIPPFNLLNPKSLLSWINYKKITIIADSYIDILEVEFFCKISGIEVQVINVTTAKELSFSPESDYIMHVEDFDECEDKLQIIYDVMEKLEVIT